MMASDDGSQSATPRSEWLYKLMRSKPATDSRDGTIDLPLTLAFRICCQFNGGIPHYPVASCYMMQCEI